MARSPKKARMLKQLPEPQQPYKFWKDLSFFGCVLSALLLAVMVLTLFNPDSGIPKVREVQQIKQQLVAEIEQLKAENDQLAQKIEAMKTDPFWQEKIAREELNMARPDEIIYKFSE
ncbi:cell division protein FtsB [Candidatus Vecturithrix granuli]|uniref:Cell division protein FtsB n=1 Tax=Vecturithrix granuli TaxID=1499967 RepID=A0A081C883_VECG1|nr:cell division protein FtsB [Candidatus Vecturithrix granuli]